SLTWPQFYCKSTRCLCIEAPKLYDGCRALPLFHVIQDAVASERSCAVFHFILSCRWVVGVPCPVSCNAISGKSAVDFTFSIFYQVVFHYLLSFFPVSFACLAVQNFDVGSFDTFLETLCTLKRCSVTGRSCDLNDLSVFADLIYHFLCSLFTFFYV